VRERFVFEQHNYCSNVFWHMFCANFQMQWPYEFRDCYTKNLETGSYNMSPLFDGCLGDIKSWAMGPDFLRYFPEFSSDIPAVNRLPRSICDSSEQQQQQNQNQDLQEQQQPQPQPQPHFHADFDGRSSGAYTTEMGQNTHQGRMPDMNPVGSGIGYPSGVGDFPHLVAQSGVSFPFPVSYEGYENPGEFPAHGNKLIF